MEFLDSLGLFILMVGFVIGLGSVTVIDLHGFLARKSSYWTESTIRAHKITKPLIWFGLGLVIIGAGLFYRNHGVETAILIHLISLPIMVANGLFLSFKVSPFLLKREQEGKASELLPAKLQNQITLSFILSFISWWGNLAVVVWAVGR